MDALWDYGDDQKAGRFNWLSALLADTNAGKEGQAETVAQLTSSWIATIEEQLQGVVLWRNHKLLQDLLVTRLRIQVQNDIARAVHEEGETPEPRGRRQREPVQRKGGWGWCDTCAYCDSSGATACGDCCTSEHGCCGCSGSAGGCCDCSCCSCD
jgi:hypothetical protein